MSVSQKTCPKCEFHAFTQLSKAVADSIVGKELAITPEEWSKTNPIPVMVKLRDIYLLPGVGAHVYRCPVCGYLEWWSQVGEEMKST